MLGAILYGEYPASGLEPGDFSAPDHKYALIALQADPDPVAVFRHLLADVGMRDHPAPASLLAGLMQTSLAWNEPPQIIEARVRKLRTIAAKRRLFSAAEAVIEELGGAA